MMRTLSHCAMTASVGSRGHCVAERGLLSLSASALSMTLQSMKYRVEASIIRNNSMRHESECPKTATHRDTPSVDPRHIPEKIPDAKQRHADRTVLARFFWNCSLQCLNFFFFLFATVPSCSTYSVLCQSAMDGE